jgi:hypothetical protein
MGERTFRAGCSGPGSRFSDLVAGRVQGWWVVDRDPKDHADEVWNRACDALASGLPSEARTGDVMLLRAIAFDGRVHNGGLLDRIEEDEGLDEAIEALRWFGLLDAAARVERVRCELRRLTDDRAPDEAFDELEREADRAYVELPQGELADQLAAALVARLEQEPEAFSPT